MDWVCKKRANYPRREIIQWRILIKETWYILAVFGHMRKFIDDCGSVAIPPITTVHAHIISHGFYISYPIFHCSFYCRAVNIQTIYELNKNLFQFLSLKSVGYDSTRLVLILVIKASCLIATPLVSKMVPTLHNWIAYCLPSYN